MTMCDLENCNNEATHYCDLPDSYVNPTCKDRTFYCAKHRADYPASYEWISLIPITMTAPIGACARLPLRERQLRQDADFEWPEEFDF